MTRAGSLIVHNRLSSCSIVAQPGIRLLNWPPRCTTGHPVMHLVDVEPGCTPGRPVVQPDKLSIGTEHTELNV